MDLAVELANSLRVLPQRERIAGMAILNEKDGSN
jgi:hypothetical protein